MRKEGEKGKEGDVGGKAGSGSEGGVGIKTKVANNSGRREEGGKQGKAPKKTPPHGEKNPHAWAPEKIFAGGGQAQKNRKDRGRASVSYFCPPPPPSAGAHGYHQRVVWCCGLSHSVACTKLL